MKFKLYLLSILVCFLFTQLQAQSVFTIAGNGTQGFAGDGNPALAASLNQPHGLAMDKFGNIYFADFSNNRIRKIDGVTGIITTVAGNGAADYTGDGGPATSAALYNPIDVKVDDAGNLFIADYNNGLIRKVDGVTGIISTIGGTQSGTAPYKDGVLATETLLLQPYGLALDKDGNLYIVSQYASTVRMINVSNGFIYGVAGDFTKADHYSGDGGPATDAAMYEPTGVAVDNDYNVYIADHVNGRIRKVTAATGIISTYSDQIGGQGIAVDNAGVVYVTGANNIYKLGADGSIHNIGGNGSAGTDGSYYDGPVFGAQFYGPANLMLVGNEVFVSDTYHNRIRRIRKYAALPYTQSFTPAWKNGNSTSDIPDLAWKNTPATGNNSWRRYEDGVSADWTNPTGPGYVPTNSQTYCCWSSARFHAGEADGAGNLDLYIDLTNSNGSVQLSYNFISPAPESPIKVFFSAGGGNFQELPVDSTIGSGGQPNWKKALYTINSSAPNAIIRFQGKPSEHDFGMDQLNVLPACTGTPLNGDISPYGTQVMCYGTNATLNAYNTSGGQFYGYKYSWQQSTDHGNTWVNAAGPGANTSSYNTPAFTKTIQYRFNTTCTLNGQSAQSVPVTFTVNAPVAAAYPYQQDFENWQNGCDITDIAGKEWLQSSAHGYDAWRRDDQGNSAQWQSPDYNGYTPVSSTGAHSARFHSNGTYGNGSMDLHINMQGSANTAQLGFDYINTSGDDSLIVYMSKDKGANFTRIASLATNAGWTHYVYTLASNSANTIVRFKAIGDRGDTDLGIDNITISNAADPTITISSDATGEICPGSTVTFTASITQQGTTQSYQWKKNGKPVGADATTYSDAALKSIDVISCALTTAGKTVQSNGLSVMKSVKDKVKEKITIDKSKTICAGTVITFTATPENGGSAPIYQWYKNDISVGTNSDTYTDAGLQDADSVYAIITSDAGCVVSNTVKSNVMKFVVLNSVPGAVTGFSGPTTVNKNQNYIHFSVDDQPNTNFQWNPPAGAFVEDGQNTSSVHIDWGFNSGTLIVKAKNACGVSPLLSVYITAQRGGGGEGPCCGGGEGATAGKLTPVGTAKIYPNPAQNQASVIFESSVAGGEYQLEIKDANGKLVKLQKGTLVKGTNNTSVDVHALTQGTYFATVRDKTNTPRTFKLVVAR